MNFSRAQRTNAPGDSWMQHTPATGLRAAAGAVRRGSAWLWLLTFLFVVQAHATHLHLAGSSPRGVASLHAPVTTADGVGTSDEGACALCTTLATARHTTPAVVIPQGATIDRLSAARQVHGVVPLFVFDLFCRPPPVENAALDHAGEGNAL